MVELFIWLIIAVGTVILIIVGIIQSGQRELEDYNKKHKTNFKTIADLRNEELKIKKKETVKKEKLLEKEHQGKGSSKTLIYAIILVGVVTIGFGFILRSIDTEDLFSFESFFKKEKTVQEKRIEQLESRVKYLERNQTSAEKNKKTIRDIQDCLMADLEILMCAGID